MNLLRLGPLAVGLSSVLMVLACGGGDEGVKTAKDTLPGQPDMAMKEYDRAVRLAPNKAIAYYARGGAYGRLGQYQRAIAAQRYRVAYGGGGSVRINRSQCCDIRLGCDVVD